MNRAETTSMDDQIRFRELLRSLSVAFSKEPRAGGVLASQSLKSANIGTYRRIASEQDPSSVLETVSRLPGALPVVDQVILCATQLDWTCWEGEGLDDAISRRLFTTELLGPDGHIPAEDVRVGLLISDAWTDYPVSSHSGEETYIVLAGVAEWVVGDTDYVRRLPGEFVHHPAWVPHGRRTKNDPFLGAWRWSGDLDLSTFSVA